MAAKIDIDALGPMVALEQKMLRSRRDKSCADCGDPGTVKQTPSRFLQAVSHYWFCDECHVYWEAKRLDA